MIDTCDRMLTDSNPYAWKLPANMLYQALHPIVRSGAAEGLELHASNRQIHLVENNHNSIGRQVEVASKCTHSSSAQVHIRHRPYEADVGVAYTPHTIVSFELPCFQVDFVPFREHADNLESHVVPRTRILAPGIT
jgi:hypothetical protein